MTPMGTRSQAKHLQAALEDEIKSPRIQEQTMTSKAVLLKGSPRLTFCTDNDCHL